MKLTKLEMEILNHRLEVDDAIAEVLFGEPTEDQGGRVTLICWTLEEGKFDDADLVDRNLTRDILIDCIEGSTFIAGCEADCMGNAAIGRRIDAGRRLAERIRVRYHLNEAPDFTTH